MTTKNKAAQALRAIPSAKRDAASRVNGTKGGRPRTRQSLDKVVPWHRIELVRGETATFCTLSQLGGLIQCHGGKVGTIVPARPGIDARPSVSVPSGQEEYFAGVAKFRANKFCKSIA